MRWHNSGDTEVAMQITEPGASLPSRLPVMTSSTCSPVATMIMTTSDR